MNVPVDRAFIRLAEGLVHYRHAGADIDGATPLYLAHAGPGSSRGLAPLVGGFGGSRWTIAPDMLGNGDSDPPAMRDTDIPYYADCAVRILDRLGIDQVDFYGTHTGAMIGIALALAHPDRVRKIVLDGVMLLPRDRAAHMIANYAPRMAPDDHGGHLAWAYQFCRDMMLFYPYFERTPENWTGGGAPSAEFLHPMLIDVLKALTTYDIAYKAAFAYDVGAFLTQVGQPALLTYSALDPLLSDMAEATRLLPAAEVVVHPAEATPEQIVARVTAFLDA